MTNKPEIKYLKGVGPKRAEAFAKLGLQFADDLFTVYPRDYIVKTTIRELWKHPDKLVLICARISDKRMPFKPKHPTKILIDDNTGITEVLVWGNSFYREKQFKIGDKYLFIGKISYNVFEKREQFELRDHKKFEESDEEMLKYPLLPLYIVSG
ncbi:MAG TPA: OB-fold nucleic acid binding domain-containing protein, partial [Ignavibacteria bacterium]|nr:OB-fold nucleic acid binding domain-containing protein [Ignavibacteria bacterium]